MKTGGQQVRCAVCATPAETNVPGHRHDAGHNGQTYTLHRCPDCDLQFWWPLKADPSVYAGEGFEAYADYHAGTRPFPRWAEPLFGTLSAAPGRVLDIGCGDGAVLDRLAKAGFEAHGIDLDEKSIEVARGKFGLERTQITTLDDYVAACDAQGLRFDLITFFEVLEHQDDPLAFLGQVARIGRPGGQVAGSVPNRNRFLARLDRKLSDGDLPPHHFLWFSATALAGLLQRMGFTDIAISKVGALPYAAIVAKLSAALRRKAVRWPFGRVAAPMLGAIAPIASIVPWLGMRTAPSHLFFSCRIGGLSRTPPLTDAP